MILKNKKALILSSLLTLLPIPVGLVLQDRFSPVFADAMLFHVVVLPLTLLAAQWLCILMTALDKGNRDRNRKPMSMVIWIMPCLSCLTSGMMYALFLGLPFSPVTWMMVFMGILFIAIGNYMPKTKMNATLGIKIRWTYSSEENWNATHRLAGKTWVVGGLSLILGALLHGSIALYVMIAIFAVMIFLPCWYSWRFYRKELAEGKPLKDGYPPVNKKIGKVSAVFLAVLLVFVAVLMFTGDLHYQFGEASFTVEASWYSDLTVAYDDITAVEYRDGNVPGYRVGGFGSGRLLMGFFQNDAFGTYTRYTYHNPPACVVLTVDGNQLVLSGATAAETKAIYEEITARIH